MKKIICASIASLIIMGTSVSYAFSDVSSKHWAKGAIDKMVEQGIISGYTDGTFQPSRNLSKIETGQTFPSVDTLEKISKKLDCNYSILFDFENLNDILSLRNSAIRNINKLNNENLIKISKILDILIY